MLEPLRGRAAAPPPIWLMRQAGRFLPEYRATRAAAGSFLDLCYTPQLAAEVTLQPIRRFGFDASIIFSDILVVPHALGQHLSFVDGEGPRLEPIRDLASLARLDLAKTTPRFALIWETVERVRRELPVETTLIGFCGAPWTVATYMVEGRGSSDQSAARSWAYRDPEGFQKLIDVIVEASVEYLSGQVRAGADVLQIFDSWAGSLAEGEFARWVIAPTKRIVRAMKERHPETPVIGFPRGGGLHLNTYVKATDVAGVGCDTSCPLSTMREVARSGTAVQGNLDPLLLVAGGTALDRRTDEILEALNGLPFIFNLGHGVVPETPPEHVAQLIARVRRAR